MRITFGKGINRNGKKEERDEKPSSDTMTNRFQQAGNLDEEPRKTMDARFRPAEDKDLKGKTMADRFQQAGNLDEEPRKTMNARFRPAEDKDLKGKTMADRFQQAGNLDEEPRKTMTDRFQQAEELGKERKDDDYNPEDEEIEAGEITDIFFNGWTSEDLKIIFSTNEAGKTTAYEQPKGKQDAKRNEESLSEKEAKIERGNN